jgi:WD40 repeat protein
VHLITWNPTSESVLASCSFDNTVKVWNAQKPDQVLSIGPLSDPALSLEWNENGSLLGTVWKDKMLRILDPRIGQVVQEANSHEGPKSQKFTWMTGDYCLTVGFSKDFHRQYYLWNLKNLEKP